MTFEKSKKEKGDEAENKFKEWLDKHNLPYWYIRQDLSSFSPSLKDIYKRPDFFILIPQFGTMMIDIKYQKISKNATIGISEEDVRKYRNLQESFNLPSWFVISNDDFKYQTWFWISILKISKKGLLLENKDGHKYYSINLSDFTQVASNETLDKVFRDSLKSK